MTFSSIRSFLARYRRRIPLILQFEIVECGAACLSMILRYYGTYLSLSELRTACGVSRDGSNMLNIKKAALTYGLEVKAFRLSCEQLAGKKSIFPAICWWDYNHFIVLEKIVCNNYYISDPAMGRYVLNGQDFMESYSGLLLTFSPSSTYRPLGKASNPLKLFLPYLYSYKFSIILLGSLTLAALAPSLMTPALSGAFVNDFLQDKRYNLGIPIIWLSLCVAVLSLCLSQVELKVVRRMALQIQRKLTLWIAVKLLSVDISFYTSRYLGDIASRLQLGSSVSSALVHNLLPVILGLVGALLTLPFVLLISWQLSLFSLTYACITIIVSLISVSLVIDSSKAIQLDSGKLQGLSVRIFSDIKTIKASALQHNYLERYQELFAPILEKQQSIQITSSILSWISTLIESFYSYGSIALSGFLVMKGELNLAGFMAFQVLRSQVTAPLMGISSLVSTYQTSVAELSRLDDLTSAPSDDRVHNISELGKVLGPPSDVNGDSNVLSKHLFDDFDGGIRASNITMSFSPLSEPVLSNLNLTIEKGRMITIVGPSGSGKTTLIKLFAGIYKESDGELLFGGHPWEEYHPGVLRSSIGYVSQDSVALNGTIAENITLYNNSISDEDILYSIGVAQLDEYINQAKDGLNTYVKDSGRSMSGGQLQRLEIARAIVKRPKVLCLDEATSSLDIPTERKLLTALKSEGYTIICVAHRLISAMMSDTVVVIQAGRVVECGDPIELSANPDSFLSSLLMKEDS